MTTATTPHRSAARTASSHADAAPARSDPVRGAVRRGNAALGRMIPVDVPLFMLRVFPAAVFWLSARTKVDGFAIADSTYFLFQHEYALPVIPSALAAVLATVAEHLFAVLLIAGLFTRFAALSLLVMTLVIQVFVYPGAWVTHGLWAACFVTVIACGPGRLSLDRLLRLER